MAKDCPAQTQPASRRANIHSLYLAVISGENFDAAAGRRFLIHSRNEEGDVLAQKFLHGKGMTALQRIWMAPQLLVQLTQQLQRIG
jgi:hypothetical protein